MLHTNKLATKGHAKLERLPIFYKEIFEAFSESKSTTEIDNMNTSDFLRQSLWGNNIHFSIKIGRSFLKIGMMREFCMLKTL